MIHVILVRVVQVVVQKEVEMKKSIHPLTALLVAAMLAVCPSFPSFGGTPAGLASPETVAGFPSYADGLISLMIRSVDGSIGEQERIIKTLAHLPQIKQGEWEGIKTTLAVFQESWGNAGMYWFALPDGRYYTVEKGLTDQNLKDRPYFPELLAGKAVVGALVVSKSTGKKSSVTAIPVQDDKNRMVGALGVTLFLEKLDSALASALPLPEGVLFYALGKNGITALHHKLDLVFDNPLAKDSPSLKTAAEKMLSTESGEVEYEFNGFKKRVRYRTSSLTGWRFAVGINIKKL
jgi:hypothetical protein